MIAIRDEIRAIERGHWPRDDNPLKHAPHTARRYPRTSGRIPIRGPAPRTRCRTRAAKYWSPVGRVDNVYGDRNLVCTCPPVSAYQAP